MMKKLNKIVSVGQWLVLLLVSLMSGIGMYTSTNSWQDTMYTCLWCLTMVMITDKVDKTK